MQRQTLGLIDVHQERTRLVADACHGRTIGIPDAGQHQGCLVGGFAPFHPIEQPCAQDALRVGADGPLDRHAGGSVEPLQPRSPIEAHAAGVPVVSPIRTNGTMTSSHANSTCVTTFLPTGAQAA